MASHSPSGVTRWGTSIQITKRGVDAMKKYWGFGDKKRLGSLEERCRKAWNKLKDKPYPSQR
jgi:hypothetical protein